MRAFCLGLLTMALMTLAVSPAHAGECKVKEPTEAAIADAIKVGVVLELQMSELAKEYQKKNWKAVESRARRARRPKHERHNDFERHRCARSDVESSKHCSEGRVRNTGR